MMEQSHVTVPSYARWLIPPEEHTDEHPFCVFPGCLCHYDPSHMERHFVQPFVAATSDAERDALLAAYRGKVRVRA